VKTGPALENTMSGDAIDVLKFPVPKVHELDGGRFIGTACIAVTRDPEEGWLNLGTYRAMVHDSKSVGLFMSSAGKHGAVAFSAVKDEARGAIDAWAKEQHHPESDDPTGPGDATGPHAAGTLIRRMGAHSDAVRGLRDEFEPIYCYYFPRTWTVLLRRWLSRHEPRYALHLQSLADLKARAWHANEESTKTWQAIAVAPLDAPLKAACHRQYELVYYDTVAMITFADFIGAMHRGAADDAARMHGAFREAAAEAQIRLRALARAADVARAHSS